MKKIIMFYGYPLSGKSTAARKLKDYFNQKEIDCEIIKSVATRFRKGEKIRFNKEHVDESIDNTREDKDLAYAILCDQAEHSDKEIVILDATFHKFYRREWIYEMAEKIKAELYVLWIVFNNVKEIKKYLDERKENQDFKDNILDDFSQYQCMVEQTDKIEDHELQKNRFMIIKFERETMKILSYNCKKEGFMTEICKILKKD